MSELRWAHPSRDDTADWAALLAAIEAADERGETHELADLDDEWASVLSRPATESVFVWEGRALVAFGWNKIQPGVTRQHRIACWGGVHPEHRGRGIGRELLAWQLRRASDVATTLDPSLDTHVNLEAADHQHELLRLAARLGFEPVRRFLEIARPTSTPLPAVPGLDGISLVQWSADLDESTRLAHAESFADHWGSDERSVEEWRQWYTGHRAFRPDLSRVAVDEASGEVVSLVLTAAYPQDWTLLPCEAWINTVGTRRRWRGRGVARALLVEVLSLVADAPDGFERSILGVDAENPTGALGLYRSLGFEDVRATATLSRSPLR